MVDHEDFSVVVKQRAPTTETAAMGNLSGWPHQPDRAVERIFRLRDGGQTLGKGGATIAVKRISRLTCKPASYLVFSVAP